MSASLGEAVLASSIVLLVLMTLVGVVLFAFKAMRTRKQKGYYEKLHKTLESGQRVQFAGGLFGELVRVGRETCDVRVKSGEVIEVSRYAIQAIES